MQITDVLRAAQQQNSSDIHIAPGNPVMLRIDGTLVPQGNMVLTDKETDNLLSPIVPRELLGELKEKGELDFAFSVEGFSRVRANVFRQRGSYAAALRILSYDVPSPQQLGIPQAVVNLTTKMRGLVLVTGATGSGKSTTLASLIDVIATRDSKNIITLEDPIEYLHSRKRSIVTQREVGKDTLSYAAALRAALRQDPDVILVGEMRDLETISTAITAAETGHLVLSTLHTSSASETISRIIDIFPPNQQAQIRVQLTMSLQAVISQRLLQGVDGKLVPCFEIMKMTPAIKTQIRDNKLHLIDNTIASSKEEGMISMDESILNLYKQGLISQEVALSNAINRELLKKKL